MKEAEQALKDLGINTRIGLIHEIEGKRYICLYHTKWFNNTHTVRFMATIPAEMGVKKTWTPIDVKWFGKVEDKTDESKPSTSDNVPSSGQDSGSSQTPQGT